MFEAEVFHRLIAHWPALGGDDASAEVRARDWLSAIGRSTPDVAAEVCTQLVEGWANSRPPRIADWHELAAAVAIYRAIPDAKTLAIDAPAIEKDRLEELVGNARRALEDAPAPVSRAAPAPRHQRKERRVGDPPEKVIDPNRRLATYDEVYGATDEAGSG